MVNRRLDMVAHGDDYDERFDLIEEIVARLESPVGIHCWLRWACQSPVISNRAWCRNSDEQVG